MPQKYEGVGEALESAAGRRACFQGRAPAVSAGRLSRHPVAEIGQASGAGDRPLNALGSEKVTITNASGVHGDIMAQIHGLGDPQPSARPADLRGAQAKKEWKKVLHDPLPARRWSSSASAPSASQSATSRAPWGCVSSVSGRIRNTRRGPTTWWEWIKLPRVLGKADYVSIILPLTENTRKVIDEKTFAAMKKGAYFINTGRGKIVRRGGARRRR